MNRHMDPDRLLGLELLAAVNTLRPDAAPLLALLDQLGHDHTATCTEAACSALVAAWRGAQDRTPGARPNGSRWLVLADLGVAEQAHAAVTFALNVAHASVERAASDDAGPLLH
jgi:hypothetical protein